MPVSICTQKEFLIESKLNGFWGGFVVTLGLCGAATSMEFTHGGFVLVIIIFIIIIIIIIVIVSEALFYTGVTTLFRDPWGGLSLVPLITILLRFVLLIFRGLFNCWCEENTGNTS